LDREAQQREQEHDVHSAWAPNGSRLSCGRPAHRRKGVGRQSVPARAQRSVSLTALTARQPQALLGGIIPGR